MAIADVSGTSLASLISLPGRRAVVTGGAQGLGKAMARRLAEAGAFVLIGDRQLQQAEAAAGELAASELGGIDIWVNNAGLYPNVRLLDMTDEAWDQVMGVNLRGVFASCREAARRMIDAGKGGVLINVVSTAGFGGVAPG